MEGRGCFRRYICEREGFRNVGLFYLVSMAYNLSVMRHWQCESLSLKLMNSQW